MKQGGITDYVCCCGWGARTVLHEGGQPFPVITIRQVLEE